MEISRAWADDSNDVSHLSISHLYGSLNPKTKNSKMFKIILEYPRSLESSAQALLISTKKK